MNKQSNLFATAQFLTSPKAIKNTLHSQKIFLVAEVNNKTVGFILGKMRTRGVCFNLLLAVDKPFRRRGIGGGLIIAMLKLLSLKQVDGLPNPYYSWKWYAEVPAYNFEALQMYKALNFPVEGILRKHTSAKTDIYILAFYLDERQIPEYGKHVHNPIDIDDSLLLPDFHSHLKERLNERCSLKSKVSLLKMYG